MVYFISDIHLGFGGTEAERIKEELLLKFLEKIKKNCEVLFIVGDLFDYWFDYKHVIPRKFFRTLAALDNLKKNDIQIEYLMGNHDFGHWIFFEKELSIPIYKNDIEREINGTAFYISHGDGKAYNDTGYRVLKKILRNPVSNWLYRLLHPDIGIGLASSSSKTSRNYTDKKDFGETDGMKDFAANKIEEGCDFVIMGHKHQIEKHNFGKGIYYNLGDWLNEPTFGYFDGTEMHLSYVKDFIEKGNLIPIEF